jgi:uncharacterized membrane protein
MANTNNEAKNASAKDPDVENNKIIAALSYGWILFLVPLLGKRDSKFAQFHAKQGLILFLIELVAGLVMWFPFFGQLLMLALIIVAVVGIIKALNGEWWKIPYIYEWSLKINL